MENFSKIIRAAVFAAEKHTGQKRKDGHQPYINHPLEVADLLVNVGNVDDEEMIAAALLHDTVEDCDVSFEQVEENFGAVTAGYVRELTDDKSVPKAERKRLQVEHAPDMSAGAKQIKLADKISNVRDVVENPPSDWDDERRREYIEWSVRVVAGLRGANKALEDRFDEVAAMAREQIDAR